MWSVSPTAATPSPGTKDGTGAGDHDLPYRFGCRPRVGATFPFSERQYARLLILRGRYQTQRLEASPLATALGRFPGLRSKG
jgi:hypothetical protein